MAFIGLGSNLDPLFNLELALKKLSVELSIYGEAITQISPVFQTPALVPQNAPEEWRKSFLNLVVEVSFKDSAQNLFTLLKKVEKELGRNNSERWSPRKIDLDLLIFGKEKINTPQLQVPHASMNDRGFVLSPLKALNMDHLNSYRKLISNHPKEALPVWMGILNITPDSFSDGGLHTDLKQLQLTLSQWDEQHIQIIDLGAESTRPMAETICPRQEWERLEPSLKLIYNHYKNKPLKPQISIDTRNSETALKALDYNIDIINDVSGLPDDSMLKVLQQSNCKYVLMHSLSVPANPALHLDEKINVVEEIKNWAQEKVNFLINNNIARHRIWLDPGIGFGKTAQQSVFLIRNIEKFFDLNLPVVVGHSRKSFYKYWDKSDSIISKDLNTLATAIYLAEKGVDVIRVHQAAHISKSFHIYQDLKK